MKIIIADDHEIYREGFSGLFAHDKEINVAGKAGNGKELLELVEKIRPDVVLTDIMMPEMSGIEATWRLKKRHPGVKVLALSMFNEENLVLDMMNAGANGYLLKNAHKDDLKEAMCSVFDNHQYFCKETSMKLAGLIARMKSDTWDTDHGIRFTSKELEVIKFICEGYFSAEISASMNLSVRTVEGYRNKIYHKMKVRNSAGIVVYALRKGLFKLD